MKKNQINMSHISIDYKYILRQPDLTAFEKLIYIIIDLEQPCDFDTICKQTNITLNTAVNMVNTLEAKGLIVKSTTSANMFYPAFRLTKVTKKKETTKEKTTITDKDKDLMLLIKKLEDYYKQRGVTYKLSKKGRKYLGQALSYLNKLWEDKGEADEFNLLKSKEDLYNSYIEFTFRNLDDKDLKHTKRLTYAATKSAWRAHLKNTHTTFNPFLLKRSFSDTEYYSIEKKEIPKNPRGKGYWTTVETFLINKWKTKTYPVCKQVLYALERVIVAHLFRKQPLEDLIEMHSQYASEYRSAEARNRLDDLVEYIKMNKKRSNICHDCTKKNDCTSNASNAIILNCNSKKTT